MRSGLRVEGGEDAGIFLSHEVACRHLNVIEEELKLVELAHDRDRDTRSSQALGICVDHEQRQAMRLRLALRLSIFKRGGPCDHKHVVGLVDT